MLEIVFTLCAIGASNNCVQKTRTIEGPATPYVCASATQIEAAKLAEELPNYRVTRARCGAPGQFAKA